MYKVFGGITSPHELASKFVTWENKCFRFSYVKDNRYAIFEEFAIFEYFI